MVSIPFIDSPWPKAAATVSGIIGQGGPMPHLQAMPLHGVPVAGGSADDMGAAA